VIPGAPKRAAEVKGDAKAGGDAEILAMLLAVDMNEVVAAMEAAKKKLSLQVADYAKMLHTEHGKHSADTMKLGLQIGVTPINTPAVDKLRIKGSGELAAILPLEGEEFGKAYLDAMIKGHTEVLDMIDNQLLKNTSNDAVKNHLTETRKLIARHLEKAKKIQGGAK
jgi:putative membrane protein